jgi:hypothetical protein
MHAHEGSTTILRFYLAPENRASAVCWAVWAARLPAQAPTEPRRGCFFVSAPARLSPSVATRDKTSESIHQSIQPG